MELWSRHCLTPIVLTSVPMSYVSCCKDVSNSIETETAAKSGVDTTNGAMAGMFRAPAGQ